MRPFALLALLAATTYADGHATNSTSTDVHPNEHDAKVHDDHDHDAKDHDKDHDEHD